MTPSDLQIPTHSPSPPPPMSATEGWTHHFRRIAQQPPALQSLLLNKLSCSLRLPLSSVHSAFQDYLSTGSEAPPASFD
ncbi:MAG: hypothetical protein NW237_04835 [Cyanobacteriota bacterium]|nr:hypothetical protein [Cyanobacteriota bacterium]